MTLVRNPPRRGRAGVALLLTAILGIGLLGGWFLAWSATHDAIRGERFLVQRAERGAGVQQALAQAVLLLETGTPWTSPFECIATVPASPEAYVCHVTYTQQAALEWSVEVREATDAEALTGTPMPPTF